MNTTAQTISFTSRNGVTVTVEREIYDGLVAQQAARPYTPEERKRFKMQTLEQVARAIILTNAMRKQEHERDVKHCHPRSFDAQYHRHVIRMLTVYPDYCRA